MNSIYVTIYAILLIVIAFFTFNALKNAYMSIKLSKISKILKVELSKDVRQLKNIKGYENILSDYYSLGFLSNFCSSYARLKGLSPQETKNLLLVTYADLFSYQDAIIMMKKTTDLLSLKHEKYVLGAKEGYKAAIIFRDTNSYSLYWSNYMCYLINNKKI